MIKLSMLALEVALRLLNFVLRRLEARPKPDPAPEPVDPNSGEPVTDVTTALE